MSRRKVSRRRLRRFGLRIMRFADHAKSMLPLITICFLILYFGLTYRAFWGSVFTIEKDENLFQLVLGAPALVVLMRAILFYLLPTVALVIILYLIFTNWNKLRIGSNHLYLEMENTLKSTKQSHRKTFQRLLNAVDEEIVHQLNVIDKFYKQVLFSALQPPEVFSLFYSYLCEVFTVKEGQLECVIYLTLPEGEVVGLDERGNFFKKNERLGPVFEEIIKSRVSVYCDDVEKQFQGKVEEGTAIHSLIGAPLICGQNICGLVLVFSQEESNKTFRIKDAPILNLYCHYMSIQLCCHNIFWETYDDIERWLKTAEQPLEP